MLPRHILCVLTLVLCCSYVSLVSAASHESTGKFNNLMHGRNSSLSAEPLAAMHWRLRWYYVDHAEQIIKKSEQVKKQAQSVVRKWEPWTKKASDTLLKLHNVKFTIDALTVPEKSELLKLHEETRQKVQEVYNAADTARMGADSVLYNVERVIERLTKLKNNIDNAQAEQEREFDNEIEYGKNTVLDSIKGMKERGEKAIRAVTAAKQALDKFDNLLKKATQKQNQQQKKKEREEAAADISSTQNNQSYTSQEEITPATQSTGVKEPDTDSEQTVDKEHPEQHKEKEPAATKEAGESLSTTFNIPDLVEEDQSLDNVPEGAQEKEEGPKAPSVKPVEAGEKDKNQKEELEKDAQGSRENVDQNPKENTEEKDKTADLSNSSTPNIRNDMDGTNTLGWLHLLLLAVTALTYVAAYWEF